jgi:hypothetical protein
LAERLSLWDIDDCVAFVATITNRSGLNLNWADREDLEAYLVTTLWEISLTYEPGRINGGFSTFAGYLLRRRAHDWLRTKNGRTRWVFGDGRVHTRERPQLVPFDDSALDRLEQSLAERNGDRQAGSDLSFTGLDSEGDWQRARDLELLGLEAPG